MADDANGTNLTLVNDINTWTTVALETYTTTGYTIKEVTQNSFKLQLAYSLGYVDTDGQTERTNFYSKYIRVVVNAGGTDSTGSDLLLKDNVTTIESAIEKLNLIRGVEFEWNEKAQKSLVGKHDVGVIAQDVEKVIPSAIVKNKEFLEVQYYKIIPLLIQSVLELSEENSDLKKRLKKLES